MLLMGRGTRNNIIEANPDLVDLKKKTRSWRDLPYKRVVVYLREVGYEDQVQSEIRSLKNNFVVLHSLDEIQKGDLVISRFSQKPFTEMLFEEIETLGSWSFNTLSQVEYIEDARQWYKDLKDLTPRSWFNLAEAKANHNGPFFVKGITNSVKDNWNQFSYADNVKELDELALRLKDDPLLSSQELFIREYVPLNYKHTNPETGAPLAEEYRVFVCDNQILSKGTYIANPEHSKLLPENVDPYSIPDEFLTEAVNRIGTKANFYALDVAKTKAGDWAVIELNDASQTGLAGNNPDVLYSKLADLIK